MTLDLVPLQFGFGVPGGMELAVILLIAILLFGANKIPKLARSTGQAIGEFKRGRQELEQELEGIQGDIQDSDDVSGSSAGGSTTAGTTAQDATTESEETSATDGGAEDVDQTDASK